MSEILNWNALIRYKAINAELKRNTFKLNQKDKEPLDIEALINACNLAYKNDGIYKKVKNKTEEYVSVGRSQVFEDIKAMKNPLGFNAPIVSQTFNGKSDYYYSESDYSIFTTNWYKQSTLQFLEKSLSIFQPELMPEGNVFIELYREVVDQLSDFDTNNRVIFKSNEPIPEWHDEFMTFYNAIIQKQVLAVKYKSFNEEEDVFDFEFHPHIIKEYNRRYYAYGYNPKEGKEWTIPLDRVLNAKSLNKKYVAEIYINKNPDGTLKAEIWSESDWTDFFSEMIGIGRYDDAVLTKIVLRLFNPDYKYFESKPIIPEDKITTLESENDDFRDYEFYLYPNRELQDAIISYIPKVEVLEPASLRSAILKRLSEATQRNQ